MPRKKKEPLQQSEKITEKKKSGVQKETDNLFSLTLSEDINIYNYNKESLNIKIEEVLKTNSIITMIIQIKGLWFRYDSEGCLTFGVLYQPFQMKIDDKPRKKIDYAFIDSDSE